MSDNRTIGKRLGSLFGLVMATSTAMISYEMHSDGWAAFWAFILWPIHLVKWAICHDINLTIIKNTFSFFFE